MKQPSDHSHYEVLDVTPDASVHEIRRAYKEVRALYDERALASYSFFTASEREAVLKRIDEAYATLTVDDRRAAYDRSIGVRSRKKSSGAVPSNGGPASAAGDPVSPVTADLLEKVRRGVVNGKARRLFKRLEGAEVVTGRDLQRLRQAIGLEVAEIEAGSGIGAGLIPALEEDRIEDLPSWLNLKSVLMTYAELLQTDPEKITLGYMKHLTSAQ